MRIYDPRVGRFLSVDPLTKKYPWYTPYQFAGNTPIQAVDLDGKEEYHYLLTLDKQGNSHLTLTSKKDFRTVFTLFGHEFKEKIPERDVVTYNGQTYNIGFSNQPLNAAYVNVFNAWKKTPNAHLFELLFYSKKESDNYGERAWHDELTKQLRDYIVQGVVTPFIFSMLTPTLRYKLGPNDQDWRGTGKTWQDAKDEAFKQTGVDKSEFEVTKWSKDINGKEVPVEYQAPGGAEVSIDNAHETDGPDAPHVGWQTPGKRGAGGGARGHIIVDAVPAGRSSQKE